MRDGELNEGCEKFKSPNFTPVSLKLRIYYETLGFNKTKWLSSQNNPGIGNISMFHGAPNIPTLRPVAPIKGK